MKLHWCGWGVLVVAWSAYSQAGETVAPIDASAISQARARIERERQEQTNLLAAEDNACLARFAVTGCQTDVAQRRRAMLSRLKHEEVVLNDAMRRQRAQDQLQRTQEKITEKAQSRKKDNAALPSVDENQKRHDEKALGPTQAASASAGQATSSPVTPVDPKVLEANRKAYQEKLKAVADKRQERDQRLLEKRPAKTALPLPPVRLVR